MSSQVEQEYNQAKQGWIAAQRRLDLHLDRLHLFAKTQRGRGRPEAEWQPGLQQGFRTAFQTYQPAVDRYLRAFRALEKTRPELRDQLIDVYLKEAKDGVLPGNRALQVKRLDTARDLMIGGGYPGLREVEEKPI